MEGRWKTHRPSTGAAVPSLDRQTDSFQASLVTEWVVSP